MTSQHEPQEPSDTTGTDNPAVPVDRETLYNEVWSEPVIVVAKKYGMSDVGLLKACRRMGVPVPTRGYWAKVRAGKVMRKLPLPPLRPDRPPPKGPTPLTPAARKMRESVKAIVDAERAAIRSVPPDQAGPYPTEEGGHVSDAMPATAPPDPMQPLVAAASSRLRVNGGWNDPTGIRAAPNEVFNLRVTGQSLERGVDLANRVVAALEARGFSFSVDLERGRTILELNGTQLEIEIIEKVTRATHEKTPAEERSLRAYHDSWRTGRSVPYPSIPQFDFNPSGRFTVTIGKFKKRNWNDSTHTDLLDRIHEIVIDTIKLAAEIRADEEAQRQREERYRRAEATYESAVAKREAERARMRELQRNAARYRKAEMLRQYIDAFEAKARLDGPISKEARDWIAWARAKADWFDPFTRVSDVLLDAPSPVRPTYWNF